MKTNIIDSINELLVKLEDDSGRLSSALTKAKIIAKKANYDPLLHFIEQELDGNFEEKLPDYRIKYAVPMGVYKNKYNGATQIVPLQMEKLFENMGLEKEEIYRRAIPATVVEMEDYIKRSQNDELQIEFLPDQFGIVREYAKESGGWIPIAAYFRLSSSTFPQIMQSIKSNLIEHLLVVQELQSGSINVEYSQFFKDGESFDAAVALSEIILEAERNIVLIDNYIDENTLRFFMKKSPEVVISILTLPRSLNERLHLFIETFNQQYKNLSVKTSKAFHDRFLIIDELDCYHIGASIKDIGKKSCMFTKIQDPNIIGSILEKYDHELKK